jgi:hypothetical protein
VLVDPARPLGRPPYVPSRRGRSPTSSCRKVWSRNRASPVCWPGVGQRSTLGSRLVAVAALVALDGAGHPGPDHLDYRPHSLTAPAGPGSTQRPSEPGMPAAQAVSRVSSCRVVRRADRVRCLSEPRRTRMPTPPVALRQHWFTQLGPAVYRLSDRPHLEGCSGGDARPSPCATGEGVWRGGAGPGTRALSRFQAEGPGRWRSVIGCSPRSTPAQGPRVAPRAGG